jgi:hypothetical protein
MHLRILSLAAVFAVCGCAYDVSAGVLVFWKNGAGTELLQYDGLTPLTAGSPADSDGAVLQLGYYNMATLLSPFVGSWVPLIGYGTTHPGQSTIGDENNQLAGRFDLS